MVGPFANCNTPGQGDAALKILRLLVIVLVLAGAALWIALLASRPEPLPEGSESVARLAAGPFAVDRSEEVWVDRSRPTAANGDYEGAKDRTFRVAIWSPVDADGPHPLLVYSHGFMSNRHGGAYLAEHMASHGYVVVATDYPLTHYGAPGGPNAEDVVHQPGDVSFLIDRTLALSRDERSFRGGIDRRRIGVLGLSLGGLTTTLVAFHPEQADPRVRAAISIAGPGAMFGPDYFDSTEVPFLMIAGTHDAMIQYETNAVPIPERIRNGGLVTIEGASHAGFTALTAGPMRLLGNPDSLGCQALTPNLDFEESADPFAMLGGPEQGMLDASGTPLPCEVAFDDAMAPGRQHWLTTLAVRAFFESQFALDAEDRAAHARYLAETLPAELEEVRYTPAARG